MVLPIVLCVLSTELSTVLLVATTGAGSFTWVEFKFLDDTKGTRVSGAFKAPVVLFLPT